MTGPETGFEQLLSALDRLGIPYFIGGSLASSVHGVPRATMDIDLVADIHERQIDSLCAELGSEFYLEPEQAKDALRNERAFNLIHYSSSYKFDIFPLLPDPYYQTQFERRRATMSAIGGLALIQFPVTTAEDTILTKLVWYKAGGKVSERQWNDVRGIVQVCGDRLDISYMRKWSRHLHVEDLLERALAKD